MNKLLTVALLIAASVAGAQESAPDTENEIQLPTLEESSEPAKPVAAPPPAAAPAPVKPTTNPATSRNSSPRAELKSADYLNPGWNPKRLKYGLGYSTGFLSAANTFTLDLYKGKESWTFYFGLNKSSDSYSTSNATSTSGTSTITTTNTSSNSGTKNPYAISLGASYNQSLIHSDWLMVRWGVFGGLDYFTKVKYSTGSRSESYASNAPDTVTVTESAYGDVDGQRAMMFKLGPVVDTNVFIRWLPQLAIGLQGGILYATDSKNTTNTTVRTRTYQRINGVDQTPSSDSSTSTEARSLGGPSISTFAINGQTFNLFGNFCLRYVW